MEKEKTIEVLNELITINNDRMEGYETASKATEEQELKTLFARFVTTSQQCKQELVTEVNQLGGKPAEGTMTSGKFFRAWMEVKAALTGKDRKAVLDCCEYGENAANETYDRVLKNDTAYLNEGQLTKINAQKLLLKADHNHISALRGALAAA